MSSLLTKLRPFYNSFRLNARILSSAAVASLLEQGQRVLLTWEDGFSSEFHARWLRHNCHCPACWNSDSSQKIVPYTELQGERMTVENIRVDGDQVMLEWANERGLRHTGQLGVAWLRDHEYSESTLRRRVAGSRRRETKALPVVSYESVQREKTGLWEWLSALDEHGLCLLTGVPLENNKVQEVASMIGPVLRTPYGSVYDVKSERVALNLAFTTGYIPLHVDLAYMETPPGVQLLHCLRRDPEVVGGENLLVDGWAVVERMRTTHPDSFKTLTEIPATFAKVQPPRHYIRHRKPHILLGRDSEVIAINWSPQNEGPLSVHHDEVEPYYRAYNILAALLEESQDKIVHVLRSGELLSFNNRRFLHSRNEYVSNGGMRLLQGCYVSSDEFQSRLKLLTKERKHDN